MTSKNTGFYVSSGRASKAKKIVRVLEEELGSELTGLSVLDIGTGNGEIAGYLSGTYSDLTSVDIEDNRVTTNSYNFVLANESLPFKNNTFDIIISNHVIEHVRDNRKHIKEIYRVLKDNGAVYLATPNRLWPWEVHYKLPFLHYLPTRLFLTILKKTGQYHEDLNLLYWKDIKNLVNDYFHIHTYCDKIIKSPDNYFLNVNSFLKNILHRIPLKFYSLFVFANPTLIVVLRKK